MIYFFCLVTLSNEFSKICDFDIYGPCPCPTYSPIADWTEIPFNALNSAFSKVLIYLLSRALMLWSLHFSLKLLVHKQPHSHVQSSKVFPDQLIARMPVPGPPDFHPCAATFLVHPQLSHSLHYLLKNWCLACFILCHHL